MNIQCLLLTAVWFNTPLCYSWNKIHIYLPHLHHISPFSPNVGHFLVLLWSMLESRLSSSFIPVESMQTTVFRTSFSLGACCLCHMNRLHIPHGSVKFDESLTLLLSSARAVDGPAPEKGAPQSPRVRL